MQCADGPNSSDDETMSPGIRNERICRLPSDSVTAAAAQPRQMKGTTSCISRWRKITRRAGMLYSATGSKAGGGSSSAADMPWQAPKSCAGQLAQDVMQWVGAE